MRQWDGQHYLFSGQRPCTRFVADRTPTTKYGPEKTTASEVRREPVSGQEGSGSMADTGEHHERIADALKSHDDKLKTCLSKEIRQKVGNSTSGELLTLMDRRGGSLKTRTPSPSPGYLGALAAYLNENGNITSNAETIAAEAVQAGCVTFLGDDVVYESAQQSVADLLAADSVLRDELGEVIIQQSRTMAREIAGAADTKSAELLVDGMSAIGHEVAVQLGQTVAGGAVITLIAKALALPAVKVAVTKAVAAALASAAFKKAVLLAAKKFGVVLLIKAVLFKLGVVAPAGVVSAAILFPVLAWILHHEWTTFPGKLASKMSDELSAGLSKRDSKLYDQLGDAFLTAAMGEIKRVFIEAGEDVAADARLRGANQQALFEAFLRRVEAGR